MSGRIVQHPRSLPPAPAFHLLSMFRRIYFAGWTLLLLVFAVQTAQRFCIDLERDRTLSPSPTSSMDRRLETLLPIPQPTATLTNALTRLPDNCSLVIVYPEGSEKWDFVHCAIGYLSWPRRIHEVKLALGENYRAVVSERTAFLFCRLAAQNVPNAQRTQIGPNVVLLSAARLR
jgi:hypothetical protein